MLKINADVKNGYMKIGVGGDIVDIMAEIVAVLQGIHEGLSERDEKAADVFKFFIESGHASFLAFGSKKVIKVFDDFLKKVFAEEESNVQH